MNHDLLILVPARGGSKRLPGKNLKPLCGLSLIRRTGEAIAQSGLRAPVLLSTDDDAIAEEGRRTEMLVPFLRPSEFSGDEAPTIDAVLHALDWFRTENGADPAATMVLQPTSPLRGGRCLRAAVDLLAMRPDADSVIAVTAIRVAADKLLFVDEKGCASRLATEPRGPVYVPSGALYLTRTARLRAERSLYAGCILPLLLDPVRSLDIDVEQDWDVAEAIINADLVPEPVSIAIERDDAR